jgi:uncharacterized membrane protein
MDSKDIKNEIKQDIHKEFALERMILFSDAVFAIVITLMAIEIQLPEVEGSMTMEELRHALVHVSPTILSYTVSFFFVGIIWHQHLKIFNLLKTYDTGLVFRNLLLLFFVGLFPFTSTVISRGPKSTLLPTMIYILVIICCIGALAFIEHYIFYKKPELRNSQDVTDLLKKHEERKTGLILMLVTVILVIITDSFVTDPNFKFVPTLWFCLLPLALAVMKKKQKKNTTGK